MISTVAKHIILLSLVGRGRDVSSTSGPTRAKVTSVNNVISLTNTTSMNAPVDVDVVGGLALLGNELGENAEGVGAAQWGAGGQAGATGAKSANCSRIA